LEVFLVYLFFDGTGVRIQEFTRVEPLLHLAKIYTLKLQNITAKIKCNSINAGRLCVGVKRFII
jgi:hypothetical protein